jgi:hypothetical protein
MRNHPAWPDALNRDAKKGVHGRAHAHRPRRDPVCRKRCSYGRGRSFSYRFSRSGSGTAQVVNHFQACARLPARFESSGATPDLWDDWSDMACGLRTPTCRGMRYLCRARPSRHALNAPIERLNALNGSRPVGPGQVAGTGQAPGTSACTKGFSSTRARERLGWTLQWSRSSEADRDGGRWCDAARCGGRDRFV